MDEVRNNPARGFLKLDILHAIARQVDRRFGIKGLSEADRHT